MFVATPQAGGDDARYPTFCTNSITGVAAAIGAVGKDLAGIIGQRIGASPAIIDIGGSDCNFFDQRSVGISSDMRLEAVNCTLALMLDPARVIVAFACGGNDRRVDKRSGLDRDRLRFELCRHCCEQQAVKIMGDQRFAKTDERGPFGRRFCS